MDNSSEKEFKQMIDAYLNTENTLILVTHKIKMLELVDRVIVIDQGQIIADGFYTPDHPTLKKYKQQAVTEA